MVNHEDERQCVMRLDLEKLLLETFARHLSQKEGHIPKHLVEAMHYSLMTPGKRIRPRLLIATAQMLELECDHILPAALALEMIHCFTLIHDDLPCMDNDDFRRGLPSNHKKFGESLALLAGDAFIPLAMEVFLESRVTPPILIQGLKRLLWASGAQGVIGGQAAESLLGSDSHLEQLRQMHSQKTGALFKAAVMIPKDFAEIEDESLKGKAICFFANELGLAFQVADDLEDQTNENLFKNSQTHLKFVENLKSEPATSILHYISASEASAMTLEKLSYATAELERHWKHKANPLLDIADEIKSKMTHAQRKCHS